MDERERLKRDLERSQKELADAKARIAALEEESKKTGQLSNIPSPCAMQPLEWLVVVAANEFVSGGERLDVGTIAARNADELRRAEQNKCRHRAVVTWHDTLPASDLDAALRRLERHFYIQRVGSVAIP